MAATSHANDSRQYSRLCATGYALVATIFPNDYPRDYPRGPHYEPAQPQELPQQHPSAPAWHRCSPESPLLPAAPHRRTRRVNHVFTMRIGRGCVRIERVTTWTGARSGLRCILVALALMPRAGGRSGHGATASELGNALQVWTLGVQCQLRQFHYIANHYDAHPCSSCSAIYALDFRLSSRARGADLFRSSWLHCYLL